MCICFAAHIRSGCSFCYSCKIRIFLPCFTFRWHLMLWEETLLNLKLIALHPCQASRPQLNPPVSHQLNPRRFLRYDSLAVTFLSSLSLCILLMLEQTHSPLRLFLHSIQRYVIVSSLPSPFIAIDCRMF